MNILITGASGFVGRNLKAHLETKDSLNIFEVVKETKLDRIEILLSQADFIVHLAGSNRPKTDEEFQLVNTDLTKTICELAEKSGRCIPIIFSSSTQVKINNPYGRSKLQAEDYLHKYSTKTESPVYIFRLPNVIGKWCRPNYNSVVATFCHNISHGLPIEIHDPDVEMTLVYIDDIIRDFINIIMQTPESAGSGVTFCSVIPEYTITVGNLAEKIQKFKESRKSLLTERVGNGLDRALYATYLSYLDVADFTYPLVQHEDPRGTFVEILKTHDSGQISYLTTKPGVTRGMHYHHTKSEKFLVVKGDAIFRYKKLYSDEVIEIMSSDRKPTVIETIPGWVHDITNTGVEDLIVLVWANEVFSNQAPDTIMSDF